MGNVVETETLKKLLQLQYGCIPLTLLQVERSGKWNLRFF